MPIESLGVLTSGADAPGMNAAVRSVVRTALSHGLAVYAIHEGYHGMVEGEQYIKKMDWDSMSGILQQGGTILGSARSEAFLTREGRLQAARNLLNHNIHSLVVIGGDDSLIGADLFCQEWPTFHAELAKQGQISKTVAKRPAHLPLVGLPASIDNDMVGTDMTIGADTALHRVITAIDRITSTAASHQRTFVVEVAGLHSGYLAMMGALGTGADWAFIPENPPDLEDWEATMCEVLQAGRMMGRRSSTVVVAEGAQDREGRPITGEQVKTVLEERLGLDTRLTVLGHLQRGGAPSAFDRYLATVLGYAAVEEITAATADTPPKLLGLHNNRVIRTPLTECVQKTQSIADLIDAKTYDKALELRGSSYDEAFRTLRTLVRALPHPPPPDQKQLRLAVMTAGSLAPGMNMVIRTATRLGIDKGHTILGIKTGFRGFIDGEIEELDWMSVDSWASEGGSNLGTNRHRPEGTDFYAIARQIEALNIDGLLVIGGWTGYETVHDMFKRRDSFPAFNIPMICLPATINNNLPGAELSVGTDTALNNILDAVDKIKESAVATRRCFVVEVMGRYCGYLALMSGLGSGAERVYLHEEGVKLADLRADVARLTENFKKGKRLGLVIRNEYVSAFYNAEFMMALFEEEGKDVFDVRYSILGHLQRGGDPSPFDRIQAIRLATRCIEYLIEEATVGSSGCSFIGLQAGKTQITGIDDLPRMTNLELQRPKEQWWMALRPIVSLMSGKEH